MGQATIYRATYTRCNGRITSSQDMTQEYVEDEVGIPGVAFWMSLPDYIRCDDSVELLSIERETVSVGGWKAR